ncbi:MAG TPA: hypothetical protein VE644_04685 [Gaiellaceae bacterium]|nr:hypothetical protein [Gaiellaceae bacterium]
MRQQLRLRVLLPVALLGLLGAGFGAYATGRPASAEPLPPAPPVTTTQEKPDKPAKKKSKPAAKKAKPSAAPERSALERALRRDRAVVVVFYTPGSAVDSAAIRDARAGALALDAGFLSVNVKRNRQVEKLAGEYGVVHAPGVLVVVRGPKVASQFGYADRETVAQAVANALR